jgi:hypothetical protein
MTEYGMPFDGILTGDATVAPYSAAEWARMWKLMHGAGTPFPNYGVFAGSGGGTYSPLEVRATAVLSSNVDVQVGAALIDGRFYETTAVKTLAINANSSGNPRIDTIILRLDYVGQTVRLAVKQGTAAASPVRPTLQQDTVYWEIPLADIAVANGFTTLGQSTISQRQQVVHSGNVGWQAYAFPFRYAIGGVLGSASIILSPARTLLVPFFLGGNMRMQDVIIRVIDATSNPYSWGWDLYVQDTNDGNTAENTLRRVAQSNGNQTGNLPGANSVLPPLEVTGSYVPLMSGMYWFAIQNRHATNNIQLDAQNYNVFDGIFHRDLRTKDTTNPNGQTLDASTGWGTGFNLPCIVLRGRILGQNAVPT